MLSRSGMPGRHQRRVCATRAAVLATPLLAVVVFSSPAAADELRCTKLADVSACEDALRSKPDNLQLRIAKADALLRAGRAADAVLAYRQAQALRPADEAIKTKLADAESQRQGLVSICQSTTGPASVDACQAALLHGAPDEFVLLKRKGILLQSMARPDPALDAFIAATLIKQDDEAVALAVVALTDSTGRKDALALAARRSALLTLEARLARAEQAARAKAKHSAGSR
jgi:tetratricopeptide (TPR) repeat protein